MLFKGFVTGLCCLFFLFLGQAHSKEPIPRSEFIKLTENAFDALDEVESTLNHSTPKVEIQKALNKLGAANKKYERYVPDVWPKGIQNDITGQIAAAKYYYGVYLVTELRSQESKEAGESAATKARELFRKYKETRTDKARK
jgi:hypothetical protein